MNDICPKHNVEIQRTESPRLYVCPNCQKFDDYSTMAYYIKVDSFYSINVNLGFIGIKESFLVCRIALGDTALIQFPEDWNLPFMEENTNKIISLFKDDKLTNFILDFNRINKIL